MIVAEVGIAAATLLATNVDNVLAVSALFMDDCFQGRNVAVGFLLATVAVTGVSMAGAALAATLPQHLKYAWLLGLVPLTIGMGKLWKSTPSLSSDQRGSLWPAGTGLHSVANESREEYTQGSQVLMAAGITLSCSVDNLAVYTAFFAQQQRNLALDATVFVLLGAAFCVLGHRIAAIEPLRRYGALLSSLLLIGVAMWIFAGV